MSKKKNKMKKCLFQIAIDLELEKFSVYNVNYCFIFINF